MTDNNTYEAESRGVAMNIFAILGFIAILLAGLWATMQLVRQVSNISTSFNKPGITLPFLADKSKLALVDNRDAIQSGESTKIAWTLGKNKREAEGSIVTLSYACKYGVYLKVLNPTTDEYNALPCNASYNVPATDSDISIIPILTDNKDSEVAFSLTYTPTKGSDESVNGILKVVNKSALTTKTTTENPNSKGTITPKTTDKEGIVGHRQVVNPPKKTIKKTIKQVVVPVRRSNPNGLPDLTVRILQIIPINSTGKVSVKLEVSNIGTKVAKGWTLTATLPTNPAYTYTSGTQSALYAGERAEMLLTFDKVKPGANALLLTVDASNSITESSETNNSASGIITTQ